MEAIVNWWKHRDYGENTLSSPSSEHMTAEAETETETDAQAHHSSRESDSAPADPLLTLKP